MWGGTCPPIGAATDTHQTDQSKFYLCCGYTGVDVHFVQRIVTSNRPKKFEMTEIFVDRSIDRSQIKKQPVLNEF